MKKGIEKLLRIITAFLMALSLLGGFATPVHAASTLTMDLPYGIFDDPSNKWGIGLTQANSAGYTSDVYARLYIDGRKVYCMQPLVVANNGSGDYSITDLETFTGTAETSRLVKWISALGYGYNGDTSDEMDFATQIRIWQQIHPGVVDTSSIHADIQAKINEINSRLAVMQSTVSFSGQTVTLSDYGKENGVTLTDTTNTFTNYSAENISGIHAEKNDNSITVWAEKSDSLSDIRIVYAAFGKTDPGTAIAYYSPSSQGVAYLNGADPHRAMLNAVFTVDMKIHKVDSDTNGLSQGDASIEGAVFTLTDTTDNIEKGTFTIGPDGTSNTITGLAPNHNYSLTETSAGTGYKVKAESVVLSASQIEDAVNNGSTEFTVTNDVITGSFNIHKIIANAHSSDFTEGEAGAEFTAILATFVEECGSFENALSRLDELTDKEYSVMVTDSNGDASSGELAYGTYIVKQTAAANENTQLMQSEFTFEVSAENQAVKTFNISNIGQEYYVRMVKYDLESGKLVTFNSASFKIKQIEDASGNSVDRYVSLKIGSKSYDVFKTASVNGTSESLPAGTFYADGEEAGNAVTPLPLSAGKYQVEEVEAPKGYLELKEPIPFTITLSEVTEEDGEGGKYIVVSAYNSKPSGKLSLTKTVEEYTADTSFIDRSDLSQIKFTLYAEKDILDMTDGSVLYEAGSVYGEYNLSRDGKLIVSDIPMGSYYLKETYIPDGYLPNETEYPVVFEQNDSTTVEYEIPLTITNKTTKLDVSKTDVTGEEELPGATLTVSDSNGVTVDSWVSGNQSHTIEGLKIGEEYTLTETIAVEGYVKATPITFSVNEDGSVTHVHMIDKIVFFTKSDGSGEEVPGALIQIIDENGEIVDGWTSTEEPHKIVGLEAGKTYTMHEEQAPNGYYYAVDAEFTVTDDGIDQFEEMIDSPIIYQILKIDDQTGAPVAGVELKLIDRTDNVEVEGSPWITTEEPIILDRVLIAGHEYELIESEWVAGVHKSTSIQFAVGENGSAETITITMVDLVNDIAFLKVNPEGEPLAGAVLQILAAEVDEDGNALPILDENGEEVIITSFTTTDQYSGVSIDDEGNNISELLKGDVLKNADAESADDPADPVYILREISAPFGYELAEDISFTVSGTLDQPQMIQMTDERKEFYVSVVKVDAADESKLLKGAEITLFKSDGTVAKDVNGKECVGITDGNGNIVFNVHYLEDGYYVQETAAPTGYRINRNHYDVVLSEDYDFAENNPVKIVVNDEAVPATGVAAPLGSAAIGLGSLAAAILFFRRRKTA